MRNLRILGPITMCSQRVRLLLGTLAPLRKPIIVLLAGLCLTDGGAYAQSQTDRIIVLGEDSDEGAVQRDDEVYARVISVLQNSLSEAGYLVVDEQLLSAKLGLEFLTGVRRQEFIVPLQAANTSDDPTVQSRLAFVFSVVPLLQDMSMTRQLKVRIRGEIYDLATLRMLRSTEVENTKPKILPLDEDMCNEACVRDAVGDQARQLASQLSMDLINKINELNAQQSTYTVLKLSLAGFDRETTIQLSRVLAASPDILASEVLADKDGRRVYSVTTTKDVGYLEELVAGILLEAGFDGTRLQTEVASDGLNVDLADGVPGAGRTAIVEIEIGGEGLSSGDIRKLSGLVMETFGTDSVALKGSSDLGRSFSVQTSASLLGVEATLAKMMEDAGYAQGSYDLVLGDQAAKITVTEDIPAAPVEEILNLEDASAASLAQQRLKDLGFYAGEVDGDWGKGSSRALEKFKATKADLPDDAVWDLATQTALFAG